MKRITKTLLYSMLTLCICTLLMIGGTFALFSDRVEVNNHLSAGSLDVGLNRVAYTENSLNESGIFTQKIDKTKLDLTEDSNAIFSIQNAVPQSRYEAKIEVGNLGTVAFDYGMRIIWTNRNTATGEALALADQIQITVTSTKLEAPVTFMLNECEEEENRISLGYLNNTKAETFTVEALFVDDDSVNNQAMSALLKFDVQVFATQKVN